MTPPHARTDETRRLRVLTLLLAVAVGIVVANIYYVQPIVGEISRDYGVPVAASGLLVTITQLGYAAGLVLVVPLGDIVENRRLTVSMLAILVVALAVAAFSPGIATFLLASLAIGMAATAVQVIVPYAGHLATDATRGRVVGTVVSGLFLGIMLSRPLASFAAHAFGARSIFVASAVATGATALVLLARMPPRAPRGMPYPRMLASLWPLLRDTKVLHRRGAYQAALFGGFSVFWTAVPLYLEGPPFRFSQLGIGLFALAGAGGALISPVAGRLADAGHARAVTGAALAGGVLAFLVALAGGLAGSWPVLMVAALLLDVATAANLVTGQREIFALGAAERSRLNGLFLALFFLGGALGSLLAGLAFARGWTPTCLVGALFPLVALAYFWTRRDAERSDA